MRDITVTVYKFHELPTERAKERARDWWRSDWQSCWPWHNEWWRSSRGFSEVAPINIVSADYDRGCVEIDWTGDLDVAELSGLRAWKWLQNNGWFDLAQRNAQGDCTLTGFVGDCDLFDPLNELRDNPAIVPNLIQVFYECAQSWVYAARHDMEYSYSNESVDDALIMNEYEFTENGAIH